MAEQKKRTEQKESYSLMKKETVDIVAARVRQFQESGQLHLPANYSAENAMKSAWLTIQSTVNLDKRPALEVCTKDSVANSLLDMVVQGLNPVKKQCYFIVYGNKLVCQRSYFGTMAVAMQADETIQDIFAEVVYQGDKFKYRIDRGKKIITEHEQDLENIDGKKIKAAYALIVSEDGEIARTEIMTIDEIKKAWAQSQMKPIDDKGNVKGGTTHDKFSAEMAKKTVINRICKPIINSSSDKNLLRSFNRTSEVIAEEDAAAEIAENANKEIIDIDTDVIEGDYEECENAQPEQDAEEDSTQEGQPEASATEGQSQDEGLFPGQGEPQQKSGPRWAKK